MTPQVLLLDPDELVIDWNSNGRWKASELNVDDLVESIQREGQIEPIEVRKRPSDGRYVVTLGFRRTMAIKTINHLRQPGEPLMQIMAIEMPGNSETAFRRNVEENLRRKELTPMDIAEQIRRWRALYKKSDKEIADLYARTAGWVHAHSRLLALEPEEQQLIHNNSMGLWAGFELSKFSDDVRQLIIGVIQEEGNRVTRQSVVMKGRELGKLPTLRARSRKEFVSDMNSFVGSPSHPPWLREVVDYLVQYFSGRHNLDDLHKFMSKVTEQVDQEQMDQVEAAPPVITMEGTT